MCDACSPPRIPRYEGQNLILEPQACNCKCPNTILGPTGPKCEKCNHHVKIELTEEGWKEPDLWHRGGHPVPLDRAWTGQGRIEG